MKTLIPIDPPNGLTRNDSGTWFLKDDRAYICDKCGTIQPAHAANGFQATWHCKHRKCFETVTRPLLDSDLCPYKPGAPTKKDISSSVQSRSLTNSPERKASEP